LNLKVKEHFVLDLVHSLIGVCVWICLIITWNVVFQLKRVDWGSVGDDLTFIVPRGKA